MQQRLNSLIAAVTLTMRDTIKRIDPSTYGEQQRDPHPCLTADSVVIAVTIDAGHRTTLLNDILESIAPSFGYTVAGSYIDAVILHPINSETN